MPDRHNRRKKRKSYYNPSDVITVFAVLAIIALACIFCAWLKGNPESVSFIYGKRAGTLTKDESEKLAGAVITAIAVVSLIIVGIFCVMTGKRKKRESLAKKQKEEELRELERARQRVAKARKSKGYNSDTAYNSDGYVHFDDNIDYSYTHAKYSVSDDKFLDDIFRKQKELDDLSEYEKDEKLNVIQKIVRFVKVIFKSIGKKQ